MRLGRAIILVAATAVALTAFGFHEARSDPRVRTASVLLRDWPTGQASVRVVLLSDLHVAGPDMTAERLARIVRQIGALRPDIVLIAGDFISDAATRTYSPEEAVAPLAQLHPRLGTFAVLGNHDHWHDPGAVRRALADAGVRLLDNAAVAAGPLAIGGIDDMTSGRPNIAATVAAMRRLPGARLLLSHSPDIFPAVPTDVGLVLAGHTHCGQIVLPFVGPIETMSRYGRRYACGMIEEGGKTMLVSAGLGTSILPLRLGAPPDLWVITLRGDR